MDICELIAKMNDYISPCGCERKFLEFIKTEAEKYANHTYYDMMGNLICVLNRGGKDRVMVCAHSDTSGFIINYIDENGFLHVCPLGALKGDYFIGRLVKFNNGVMGILNRIKDNNKPNDNEGYFVDIGVSSKEEALEFINIGEYGSIEPYSFVTANGGYLAGAFLDNRVCVAMQLELISELSKAKDLNNEIYFVFSVQGEMGARGAKTAAYHIEPKYALVLDCIQACGTPDCNNRGAVMGKGVCLDVLEKGFAANKIMTEFLSKTAVENKIDYIKVITESESSDASSIHLSGAGVYTSRVSAALRYNHTLGEILSLNDYNCAKNLVFQSLLTGFDFVG